MEIAKSVFYIAQLEDGSLFISKMNQENLNKYNSSEETESGYDYFEDWQYMSSKTKLINWIKEQLKGE